MTVKGPIFQIFRDPIKFEYFYFYFSHHLNYIRFFHYNLLSDIDSSGWGMVYYINKNDFTGKTLESRRIVGFL